MKTFLGWTTAVLVLASCAKGESLKEVFDRMDKAAPAFVGYTATMQETHYTKILDKSDAPEEAVVRLRRDGKDVAGLVRYKGINPRSWVFEKGIVHEYRPNANQEDVYDAKKYSGIIRQVVMLGFGMTRKELNDDYTVSDGGVQTVGGKMATRIILVPKSKEMREQYLAKFEMWIPTGEANPLRVKATQPNGDVDDAIYSNLKLLKPPLKDSDFTWDPDEKPGAKTKVNKLK